jgi:Protein of unknown function (DUF2726)
MELNSFYVGWALVSLLLVVAALALRRALSAPARPSHPNSTSAAPLSVFGSNDFPSDMLPKVLKSPLTEMEWAEVDPDESTQTLLSNVAQWNAYGARKSMLDMSQRTLLHLVRVAAPRQIVLCKVRLSDLVRILPGQDVGRRMRAYQKVVHLYCDVVLCDPALGVLLVIDLDASSSTLLDERQALLEKFKRSCIEACGYDHLSFPRDKLPRYRELRSLLKQKANERKARDAAHAAERFVPAQAFDF